MSDAGITKEHLLILMGSGIQNVVVVVNKMDTVVVGGKYEW